MGNILPGITRSTVLELADELDLGIEQGKFYQRRFVPNRQRILLGTAAEVVGIASVDDYQFPTNWNDSLGKKLQNAYSLLVREPLKQNPFKIMKTFNKYSKTITQDETQPTAQAMLYAMGLTEEDLQKPQVGIVVWVTRKSCNMHLNDLAKEVKAGVE